METNAHPYWPRALALPGYVAAARPGWQCAGAVAVAAAALLALGWALGGGGAKGGAKGVAKRSPARRLVLGWFLLCAGIHGVLEGYFSLRHRELPADTGLLADVCEHRPGQLKGGWARWGGAGLCGWLWGGVALGAGGSLGTWGGVPGASKGTGGS